MSSRLQVGLEVLRAQRYAQLAGQRVGLVTHQAAVTAEGFTAVELFASAPGLTLAKLFGPEHGLSGEAQDLEGVPARHDPQAPGVPAFSLYGDTVESLKPTRAMLHGLDVLVIDLQDVGSRYYTFQATMWYCLQAAAEVGLPVVVLDRPNPIRGVAVEGPALQPGFSSFVGIQNIAIAHGLTMGELARLYQAECFPSVDLRVVKYEGNTTCPVIDFTVPPSPNMPTRETALVYPGMCLFEGTNLSEGRGTTKPFQYIGHPRLDPVALVARMRQEGLPGVAFSPVTFRPTFQKHAGQTCGGVFVQVTDADEFQPVRAGLALLAHTRDLLAEHFAWRTECYEFVDHIPAIDLLFGSDRERLALEAGTPWREIARAWEPEEAAFAKRRTACLLYA